MSVDTLNTQDLLLECNSLPLTPLEISEKKHKKLAQTGNHPVFHVLHDTAYKKSILVWRDYIQKAPVCQAYLSYFLWSIKKCGVGERIHFLG